MRNLSNLYRLSNADDIDLGLAWYPTARVTVHAWAKHFDVSPLTVACVIAAVSPQCVWMRNLELAYDVLAERSLSPGFALHGFVAKARVLRQLTVQDVGEAMRTAFSGGFKVNAFARNLSGDNDVVTVDGPAAQAAVNAITRVRTDRLFIYNTIAYAYMDTAFAHGIVACDFQAILWHTWKRRYAPERKRDLLRRGKRR